MEEQFTPETEKKLTDLAIESGCRLDDLVEDAKAAYVEELLQTRIAYEAIAWNEIGCLPRGPALKICVLLNVCECFCLPAH